MQGVDLELFRDIPGYKAILKAVLKSQIQVLVEQLSRQTGEESVLLTACIEEGTLSHLGSDTGKVFMDSHDDIKSQFLGFCLKRQSESFVKGLTRKRGLATPRQQCSAANFQGLASTYQAPATSYVGGTNVKHESQKAKNLSKRPQTGRFKSSPTFRKAEQLPVNAHPLPTSGNNHVQMERIKSTEVNKTRDKDNQLKEQKTCNQSIESGNQSIEIGNQSVECGDQSMAAIGDVEDGSFTVVTEAGDSVYEGHVNATELTGSQEFNGTEEYTDVVEAVSMAGTDRAGLSVHDELEMYLTGEDISMSKPSVSEHHSGVSQRKVATGSKKRLKEENVDASQHPDSDDRPYPCTSCPKRFKERHHLTYHLRTHSGQRPYVCEICNKAFTQTSSLNTHRRIHLNEISCAMCGLSFRRGADFSSHVCYTTEQYNSTGVGETFDDASQSLSVDGAVGEI